MTPRHSPAKQLPLFGREVEAAQWRDRLLARLLAEEEMELYHRLKKCGSPFSLWCRGCGHEHRAAVKCNRKWCPSCAAKRGNERAARMGMVFPLMRWPMHVTLTVVNEEPGVYRPTVLKELMAAFGKLRRRPIWKKNVKGGVVSVEITDKGNGLHPHLHALIDCRWLALSTPQPWHGDDADTLKDKFRCAKEEITAAWRECVGDERVRNVDVRRCDIKAVQEVLNYALKSEDVENCHFRIGPLLRLLDSVRAVRTFGSCFGLKLPPDNERPLVCACGDQSWTPTAPLDVKLERTANESRRSAKEKLAEQRSKELEAQIEREIAEEATRIV